MLIYYFCDSRNRFLQHVQKTQAAFFIFYFFSSPESDSLTDVKALPSGGAAPSLIVSVAGVCQAQLPLFLRLIPASHYLFFLFVFFYSFLIYFHSNLYGFVLDFMSQSIAPPGAASG